MWYSFPMWISLLPPMILWGSRFTTFGLLIWMRLPSIRALGQKNTLCLTDPLSVPHLPRNGSLRRRPIKWIKRRLLPISGPSCREEPFVQVSYREQNLPERVYVDVLLSRWGCRHGIACGQYSNGSGGNQCQFHAQQMLHWPNPDTARPSTQIKGQKNHQRLASCRRQWRKHPSARQVPCAHSLSVTQLSLASYPSVLWDAVHCPIHKPRRPPQIHAKLRVLYTHWHHKLTAQPSPAHPQPHVGAILPAIQGIAHLFRSVFRRASFAIQHPQWIMGPFDSGIDNSSHHITPKLL